MMIYGENNAGMHRLGDAVKGAVRGVKPVV